MDRKGSIKQHLHNAAGRPPTQLRYAKDGIVTPEIKYASGIESLDPEIVRQEIAAGRMIIPANLKHPEALPFLIGRKAKCKVNANIGSSEILADLDYELRKLRNAIKYGADTVMDLSTGGDIPAIRNAILRESKVPIGTVPIYEAISRVNDPSDLTPELLLEVVEEQAAQGVDYMTVHASILLEHMPLVANRLTGIVSRGGSLIACWLIDHQKENPFFTRYDDLLKICAKYDVSLSLGDALRPGSLHDASDEAQFAELAVHGELARRAREKDVQVMIEGPGHIPLHEIEMNMKMEQDLCDDAPFYVLGPVVTDIAPGYDHITSAIGGTLAAFYGASMLCYVTPREHLGLPNEDDVRVGVVSSKLAAHAADVALGKPGARDMDDEMSRARYNFDWEKQFKLALDGDRARELHDEMLPGIEHKTSEYCSMCGEKFCAMRISKKVKEWNATRIK
jgi:phosphomethylpyrimidine synthase